jgi:hypothetical protein
MDVLKIYLIHSQPSPSMVRWLRQFSYQHPFLSAEQHPTCFVVCFIAQHSVGVAKHSVGFAQHSFIFFRVVRVVRGLNLPPPLKKIRYH